MESGINVGYLIFISVIMVLTGIAILTVDTKKYRAASLRRDAKASAFLGWFNIVLGIVVFAGNWILQFFM